MTSLVEKYVASMVLSGSGDALGYKNGRWEFNRSGPKIHAELAKLGGLANITVSVPQWTVSDDTVMHLATGEALVKHAQSTDSEDLYRKLAKKYQKSMLDMDGRAPGGTCTSSCRQLKPREPQGYQLPFSRSAGGCGAAMRAMCIGLRYPSEAELDKLIAVSVESGRMTHHHPTGYLGALAAALFVSYSVQGKPIPEWGAGLMDVLPKAWNYVESQGRDVEENKLTWNYFTAQWNNYLKIRGITDGKSAPSFPDNYNVDARDAFYTSLSYSGWGGASGHDAPMIAYDALLGYGGSWEELALRGMFHCGDSDSTAVIAAACYGAMHGFQGVPPGNYKEVEYRKRLTSVGLALYNLANPTQTMTEGQAKKLIKSTAC